MKLEFSRQIFEKYSNIKFHENPFIGRPVVPWGRRDTHNEPVHGTATYRCDDTRRCIIQFWPPDDEHIVIETCTGINTLIIKQEYVH